MSKQDIPLRGHYSEQSLIDRRVWLEDKTQCQLDELIETRIDPETLRGNIESYIGSVKIPVGVAGPLKIKGKYVDEDIFAPFATTEGALLSSINRGAKAITMAGGVNCQFISQSMQRAPVFECTSLVECLNLQSVIEQNLNELKTLVKQYTNFGQLKTIEFSPLGKSLHCRFNYTTNNAAGQNMTTTVTNQLCHWLLSYAEKINIKIVSFMIEGNLSGDKKANAYNFSQGRGCKVIAEVFLEERIIKRILKTNSTELTNAIHQFRNGSISTGTIGFNINCANVVAAIFTATGQDIACSHESSLAHLDIRKEEGGIYCTLMMPSLIIGTVGGGTALPAQQQCLKMMGCTGVNSAYRFAEIICAFALALDLSTASAIASGQFAASHEKLGRNKPNTGYKQSDFDLAFFQNIYANKINKTVKSIQAVDFDSSQSILAQLSKNELKKFCGFLRFNIQFEKQYQQVVLKSKPTNSEVANVLEKMAYQCDMVLGELFKQYKHQSIFAYCSTNEIHFYETYQDVLNKHLPTVEKIINEPDNQRHLIVMQDISAYPMMNTVFEPKLWTLDKIHNTLNQLASIHKTLLQHPADFIYKPNSLEQQQAAPLYQALWLYHFNEFDFVIEHESWLNPIISDYKNTVSDYFKLDMAIIHNDCNPRNMCFDPDWNLVLYDWELITYGCVFTDVLEFLLFMDEDVIKNTDLKSVIDSYLLQSKSSSAVNWNEIKTCLHFFINQRLALYLMAHNFKDYQFLPRLLKNAKYINLIISENINELNS
ncbi:MAG: phosphotransferase [Saccharospirillaceae bacterium]|nr:phosphotransferase [Pseudomonadales bacterium]NRB77510.1 phosphotransferase [Saccharospirillaceae bacterium]